MDADGAVGPTAELPDLSELPPIDEDRLGDSVLANSLRRVLACSNDVTDVIAGFNSVIEGSSAKRAEP
jgi:FXSXX-COOH protein